MIMTKLWPRFYFLSLKIILAFLTTLLFISFGEASNSPANSQSHTNSHRALWDLDREWLEVSVKAQVPEGALVSNRPLYKGNQLNLRFQLSKQGAVKGLRADTLMAIKNHGGFGVLADWEKEASELFGFVRDVPQSRFQGKCEKMPSGFSVNCVLEVSLDDEEITTLFVHMPLFYWDETSEALKVSGSVFETHADQGMVLYSQDYQF